MNQMADVTTAAESPLFEALSVVENPKKITSLGMAYAIINCILWQGITSSILSANLRSLDLQRGVPGGAVI